MSTWGNLAETAARALAAQYGRDDAWMEYLSPACALMDALNTVFRARAAELKETKDPDEYTRGWDDGAAHVCDWFLDAIEDAEDFAE